MRRLLPLPLALAAAATLAACGGDDGTLTVFAAASLREVFPRIDAAARYSFAGSDEHATQIREGAPADVYAAASPRYPAELASEGLVEEPVVFATNRLVLVVPADNPAGIGSVPDLAAEGVRLVIAAPGVPAGDYTRRALETLGREDVLAQVVSEEADVKGVVSKVALGEADAGFVYATDVAPVEDDVHVIELPEEAQPEVEYSVAVVRGSERDRAARAFVERLLGEAGREALREAGFGTP
ncbi:MAG TPA: molybdate ABC transporter substrate-binding protein [Gaiellaceae bacterium]|nr:molybdate ABC transporter substrate-binding protein [Gaiellaceae bacterium]